MISIAMTTYNGQSFIREQLESVQRQSIDDIEIIIVDDGSTDDTFFIVQEYAKTDSRIKVFQNEENLGFKKNFEKALSLCKGEYIALCDQDDVWTEDHLAVLLDSIKDGKSISCANSELIDYKGNSLGMTFKFQEACDYIPQDDIEKSYRIIYYGNVYQGSTMLLKTNFVNEVTPIPSCAIYHDTWFALCACFNNGIGHSDKTISYYRIHGTNASGDRFKRRSKLLGIMRRTICGFQNYDRVVMLREIKDKNICKNENQLQIVNEGIRRLMDKSFKQYFSNMLFLIRNFKLIFSIK